MVEPPEDVKKHEPIERRPIASRSLSWVQATSAWLVRRGASPNTISVSSTVFACLAGAAILASARLTEWNRLLWLLAALGIQLRLLANLFDGMVALASGTASPVGELFNEVPDRFSDVIIFAALGFVSGSSVHLGYLAAVLAVLVAYIRAMGATTGSGQVFAGVMSKPRRMFVATIACLTQALAPAAWLAGYDPYFGLGIIGWALVLVIAGCLVTLLTRLSAIAQALRNVDA